jgi:G:T-mismatch repair DNA endonuclease (very short patch repair protein)
MRCVRSRDTDPERLLRSALHDLGLRYRLYRRDLPGESGLSPDPCVLPGLLPIHLGKFRH